MRLRPLAAIALVLILGAWTCQVPSNDGGDDPMPGPTTTGVLALLQGEGWQFVPPVDLQNGWGVVTPPGQLFYRYREPGFVDIIGVVDGGTPGSVIATLPEGYRPGSDVFIPVVGDTTAGGTTASSAGILWLRSSGDLEGDRRPTQHAYINISGTFPVLAP